jgi:hypothetical protein
MEVFYLEELKMATVINIGDKLKREKKFINIGETQYEVDASKNAFIEALALLEELDKGKLENLDKVFERLAGKQFLADITAMKLDIEDTKTVLIGLMATIQGEDFETIEKRFRNQK